MMQRIEWRTGQNFPPGFSFRARDPNRPASAVATLAGNRSRIELENISEVRLDLIEAGMAVGYSRQQIQQILSSLPSFVSRFDITLVGSGPTTVRVRIPPGWPMSGFYLDGVPINPYCDPQTGEWIFNLSLSERTLTITFRTSPLELATTGFLLIFIGILARKILKESRR